MRHIDFAAHLDDIGHILALQGLWDFFDGADVRRDVFACLAVAALRGQNELALLLAQIGGEAIDFRLDVKGDLFVLEI
jgi:hypothetical protein